MKTLILFSVIVLFSSISLAQPPEEIMTIGVISEPEPTKPIVEPLIEDSIYDIVETDALFPNGNTALLDFLKENIKAPEIATMLGLSGTTVLKFVILKDGSIARITVARQMKDCPECDNEAIRVVRKMPKWIPAKKNGQIVNSYFILPVKFSLE